MKYFTWINKIFQRKMRRGFWGLLAVGVFAGSFAGIAGCGTDNTNNSDVKKIIVGTGHAYEPYCYLDENGNLAGYEYEVLKAVNELLPQYEFTYETFDFANQRIFVDFERKLLVWFDRCSGNKIMKYKSKHFFV